MSELIDTGNILIALAFATAVTGTLWDARPWGKALMIALALVAAGTAIYEGSLKSEATLQARQEAEAAKRNLELLIRSVQPPEIFAEAVFEQLQEAVESGGHYIASQSILDSGERIFVFAEQANDEIAGAIALNSAILQKLFLSFAKEENFSADVRNVLFGSWGSDDLDKDWNIFALNTYDIARSVLLEHVPDGTTLTGSFDPENLRGQVSVTLPTGQYAGEIEFDAAFMRSLTVATPFTRGGMIHSHTESQILR